MSVEPAASDPPAPGFARDGRLAADVHDRLRAAIITGAIPAGSTMSQLALAEQLGAGRTPLREALRMLQREGLVVSEPNRRVAIAPLTAADAEDLYVMRIALEVVALRVTLPTLRSPDVAQLEGLLAQMSHFQRSGDLAAMDGPHRAFHLRLVAGAGPRGVATIEDLFDHARRYRIVGGVELLRELWPQRAAEHRAVLDAVAAADVDAAALALARHYGRTAVDVFAELEPGHDLARVRATLTTVAPGSEDALDPPGGPSAPTGPR